MSTPSKGPADYLELGSWNAACFACGRKYKSSTMQQDWKGNYYCDKHWNPRQPQDLVRGVVDNPAPPWVQPQPTDTFQAMCTPNGLSAVPGYAMPGCMVPGYLSPAFNPEGDPN